MCDSKDFYTFWRNVKSVVSQKKVLEGYIVADCCAKYGKTAKLLKFRDYFEILYGKKKLRLLHLERRF